MGVGLMILLDLRLFNPCLIEDLLCFGVYISCMMLLCGIGVEFWA